MKDRDHALRTFLNTKLHWQTHFHVSKKQGNKGHSHASEIKNVDIEAEIAWLLAPKILDPKIPMMQFHNIFH